MTKCGGCYKREYVEPNVDYKHKLGKSNCKDDCKKCDRNCKDDCKKCERNCKDDCKKCDRNCKDDCPSCFKEQSVSNYSSDHYSESETSSDDYEPGHVNDACGCNKFSDSEDDYTEDEIECGCCCWYYHAGKEYKCKHLKEGREKACKNKYVKKRKYHAKFSSGCDDECNDNCPQRGFCEDECKPKSCDPCKRPAKKCVNVTISRACKAYTNDYFKNCEIKIKDEPKKCVRFVKASGNRNDCPKC